MSDLVKHETTTALGEHMEFARLATSGSGQSILPDAYRGNPANVLIAVNLGASMGLSPAESLYRIAVIKGKPSASAELIAANVRRAGHKLRVRGDESSCTAQVIRADDPDFPFEVTRDMAWAKGMGLDKNDNYKKQPGTMLQWRAITAVARLACPEALYGVSYTPDELSEGQGASGAPVSPQVTVDAFAPKSPEQEPETGEAPTDAAMKRMFALFTERRPDLSERDDRLRYVSLTVGREVESSSDLTAAEASRVIEALEGEGDALPVEEPPAGEGEA